jgi:hypothetical protein
MATTTTNISLTKPDATDTSLIREDINSNSDIIDGRFSSTYLAVQSKSAVSITGGNITGITDLPIADGGTGSSTAILARTALGLEIGTNVQAYDAGLLSIAALTTAANKSIYTTASDVYATYDLTAFGMSILDDANEATFKATVNLEIGTDVQAYDASLTSISALTYVSGSYIALTAADTYTVRTYTQVLSDIGAANSGANSSITSLTGLTTPLAANYGGTGIANAAGETITLTGGFALNLTLSAATGVTLPTSGTLVNSAVATLSSLTSIGTITTGGLGTGAVIAGVTMTLGSDVNYDLYYRSSNILTRLAPNTAASNKFLRMIGTGTAGQAPSWEALGASDIPDISATYSVKAGNTSLVTLGTVTTGTWTATTIKANYLQNAATDLGAADVNVVLSNSNGSYVTNLTTDGTITATVGFAGALTGNVTGNASGTAATVTGAAQAAITSLGTLTTLSIDNLTLDLNTISSTSGDINITPVAGSKIVLDGTVNIDAGVITSVTSLNALTLTSVATGFTIAGGTSSKTLTMDADITISTLIKCRNNATAAPAVGDDSDDGYAVNSVWSDVTADKSYICVDSTVGAAVWKEISPLSKVTAKTTTATLTLAEEGVILVSAAGGAYTVTLPTAVGHTGLTYHFIKTDANYTLITLAANGAQTFNYESSTGAPVATYARLNTYCAEVTVVSDGANWQCINERLGQVPECWVYLSADQLNLSSGLFTLVTLDTESYDIGSNFNTSTYKFVAPIPGKYQILGEVAWLGATVVADKIYDGAIYKNGAAIGYTNAHSSNTQYLNNSITLVDTLAINDFIQLYAYNYAEVNTVDLDGGMASVTRMLVKLVSKT